MRTLITGGCGFIGSNLCRALAGAGWEITVLDDLSTGRRENLDDLPGGGRARLVVGSILESDRLEPLVAAGPSIVYHLAAKVGVDAVCRSPGITLKVNIQGTENVLELCEKYNVGAVIASTSEAYGKSEDLPLSEEKNTILGPTSVARWAYSVSKLADEHLALSLAEKIPIAVVRYFNAYGPRMNPTGTYGVVAKFMRQALLGQPVTVYGDGRQTRSFTYVDDTVAGTIKAADAGQSGVFNIGRPQETTINDLAEMIVNVSNSRSPVVHRPYPRNLGSFEEQRRRVPDISKAREALGFEPSIRLDEGLCRTMEWMREDMARTYRKEEAV